MIRKVIFTAAVTSALLAIPATAQAHHGVPFENCTEAYKAGYANIPEGDPHYGSHLDRDQDGTGCDQPPEGFVPASPVPDATEPVEESTGPGKTELAETGGEDNTFYLGAGGAALLLAGGSVILATRKRRKAVAH